MRKKYSYYFFMISMIILYTFCILNILYSDGKNIKYLIWHGETAGIFPDLMQTVYESKEFHPYLTGSALYPPLTYLLCSILAYAIPGNLDFSSSLTPNGVLVLSLFLIGIVCAVSLLIYENLEVGKNIRISIILAFLLSAPFIYMLERGNLVLLAVFFCSYFILHYDSLSRRQRELSLISLAIAASLKLYPALLGILLLVNKKYRESVRCAIYGICFFTIPAFFTGGLRELRGMLEVIQYFQSETILDERNFGYGFKVNITNWIYAIGEQFHLSPSACSGLNYVLLSVTALILLFIIWRGQKKWQKITAALLALILIPTFSWIYNATYLTGACILYMNEVNKKSHICIYDWIYTICFIGIFVPLPYGEVLTNLHGVNKISINTLVCSVSMVLMMSTMFIENILFFKSDTYSKG